MERELGFVFKDHGAQVIMKGKPTWPNYIRIELEPHQLHDLMIRLSLQLGEEYPHFTFVGAMHREDEDGNEITPAHH